MDVIVMQLIGITVMIVLTVIVTKCIFNFRKAQDDLEIYQDEYKRIKDERDKLKIKLDTINRIYKSDDISILHNMNEVIEKLLPRLNRINKSYAVYQLDKKYLLDLTSIVSSRLSHENIKDLNKHQFVDIKIKKLTIKECSETLLRLIKNSRLFSLNMFDNTKDVDEIYKDLDQFIECVFYLLNR